MYVVGSLDRKISILSQHLESKGIMDTEIICTGNIGVRSLDDLDLFEEFNDFLKDRNLLFKGLRGPLDNPDLFTGELIYSHFCLERDFSFNNGILSVGGGGIPADRIRRKTVYSAVNIKKSTMDFLERIKGNIKVVVSSFPPQTVSIDQTDNQKFWKKIDPELSNDIYKLRSMLGIISRAVTPRHWFYSYYNKSHVVTAQNTIYVGLKNLEVSNNINVNVL